MISRPEGYPHVLPISSGSDWPEAEVSFGTSLQGFQRVADALQRDVPATRQRFEELAREAAAAGWLDPAVPTPVLAASGAATAPTARRPPARSSRCAITQNGYFDWYL